MTAKDRYDTDGLAEGQFEPGSDKTVLKNLLGITSQEEMEALEAELLWQAQEHLIDYISPGHQFSVQDIYDMHAIWLEDCIWMGWKDSTSQCQQGRLYLCGRSTRRQNDGTI